MLYLKKKTAITLINNFRQWIIGTLPCRINKTPTTHPKSTCYYFPLGPGFTTLLNQCSPQLMTDTLYRIVHKTMYSPCFLIVAWVRAPACPPKSGPAAFQRLLCLK